MNQKTLTGYQGIIAEILAALKRTDIEPRHVEGYMRLQYGTLDHLDRATFRRETKIAIQCIDLDGADEAEDLARSYGLVAS